MMARVVSKAYSAKLTLYCTISYIYIKRGPNERMRQKTSFRDRIIYYWTHKEPSTGYSKKKADSGFSELTQQRFYIVNPTGTHVHLLNGWQTGTREPRSFILPVEWKAMSLDPNRKDLRRDHA